MARAYLTRGFLPDALSALPFDAVGSALGGGGGGDGRTLAFKLLRLPRLLRLSRLLNKARAHTARDLTQPIRALRVTDMPLQSH